MKFIKGLWKDLGRIIAGTALTGLAVFSIAGCERPPPEPVTYESQEAGERAMPQEEEQSPVEPSPQPQDQTQPAMPLE
jgi:hypothetical protein